MLRLLVARHDLQRYGAELEPAITNLGACGVSGPFEKGPCKAPSPQEEEYGHHIMVPALESAY